MSSDMREENVESHQTRNMRRLKVFEERSSSIERISVLRVPVRRFARKASHQLEKAQPVNFSQSKSAKKFLNKLRLISSRISSRG